jgi:hypothetical protein
MEHKENVTLAIQFKNEIRMLQKKQDIMLEKLCMAEHYDSEISAAEISINAIDQKIENALSRISSRVSSRFSSRFTSARNSRSPSRASTPTQNIFDSDVPQNQNSVPLNPTPSTTPTIPAGQTPVTQNQNSVPPTPSTALTVPTGQTPVPQHRNSVPPTPYQTSFIEGQTTRNLDLVNKRLKVIANRSTNQNPVPRNVSVDNNPSNSKKNKSVSPTQELEKMMKGLNTGDKQNYGFTKEYIEQLNEEYFNSSPNRD